ncbi:MAG: hypothetical protein A2W90_17100 [Bacteroidetes bacterium GWF2_42_66]|nr:MAG: hypothetical protein A2W92_15635 [Bacteroidetes bacterium GWA2_42_15]OFX97752.1 MAG: hypothetical protein A2W89_06935 [Bacteroidetes bacterium GWE2_42_39]OFY45509.1 MAG: hypothetical protein A2W90_17100 [Bacteroidetes bacterium GWF2_42_66]HAZ02859.1 hypothetical protein [Marinilabiliales bacterium]HBL73805.1 hypothetical protein [Prolixibacteraceae bacterium]
MNKILGTIFILLLLGCTQVANKHEDLAKTGSASDMKVEKSFVSFRIGVPLWISETRCNELFDLFDKYKGVTDEITFFTSETHAPLPLETIKERTAILKERMEQVRKRGYKTGINILTTIGHHNENLDNSLKGDYTPMTNIDGAVCNGSFCPNDEHIREYVRDIYQFTTNANPDYIWIDDDIRFGHMPIGQGCFCDNCLKIFEKETGIKYTRESLRKAFNEGLAEEKLKIREAWLQHNRNTISYLFELIEKTVHEINPTMPLGFMTGDRFFEGYDFDNWAKVLAGPNHVPVMWRPGGGFYNDNIPGDLAGKSHDIGRQVSVLPEEVVSIQSEIENFPYQRLKKAANIVVLEACSHIAAGCTGAAFNVLSMYDEPLDEYEPLVAKLQETRPFFDMMAKSLGRSPITGIQTFWNKSSYITGKLDNGNWTSSGNPVVSHEFYEIGLPICYSNEHSAVTILGKDNIFALPKDEIQKILSGGVYMDAPTLQQLNDMGFGELTGFEVTGSETKDRIEKFTNHPLNGDFAGRERDNRQSFWNSPAYTLRKTNVNAQALTSLIDYTGKQVSDCTMGIFENKLGGRICVAGYYPWTFMENLSKSSQAKSVFRWLSKDTLPGYIASFQKINLWIREPQDEKIALAFTNSSFDAVENMTLMLRTENTTIKLYDMECKETTIRSSGSDGLYQKFVISEVDPWQMRLVVSE